MQIDGFGGGGARGLSSWDCDGGGLEESKKLPRME